jgi:hypothetical protein
MVGLSYVFPGGINFERLPKMSKADYIVKEYDQPIDMVLLLERICSSIFSLAFMAIGISIFILMFIAMAWVINLFGAPIFYAFLIVLGVMIIVSIAAPLNYLYHRKFNKYIPALSKITIGVNRVIKYMFYREPVLTFQTNINQVTSFVFFVLLFAFLGFQTGNQLANTMDFFKELTPNTLLSSIKKNDLKRPETLDPMEYNDQTDKRVHRAQINSFYVKDNLLEVFLADYRWDRKVFDQQNQDSTLAYRIHALVDLRIDGLPIESPQWFKVNHAETGQRGWIGVVQLDSLDVGLHELRIDKTTWDYLEEEVIDFETWCQIPFWIN